MSDTKYLPDLQKEIPDLEIVKLRKEVAELKKKIGTLQDILKENGIEEVEGSSHISDEELVCQQQIAKFKELSDKGIPFAAEDTKNFEVFVKTLLAIRGKTIGTDEKKSKKKKEEHKLADLIAIAKQK